MYVAEVSAPKMFAFLSFGGGHFQGKCGAGQNITTPLFLFSFCKVCVVCVTKVRLPGSGYFREIAGSLGSTFNMWYRSC